MTEVDLDAAAEQISDAPDTDAWAQTGLGCIKAESTDAEAMYEAADSAVDGSFDVVMLTATTFQFQF